MKERFDRYEDAVGAVMTALKGGILPGGGIALAQASINVEFNEKLNNDFKEGFCNVLNACIKPLEQILINSDITQSFELGEFSIGVDASKNSVVDMYDVGIVDPFNVTISALKSAVSIAIMILTTGCVIDSTRINIISDE